MSLLTPAFITQLNAGVSVPVILGGVDEVETPVQAHSKKLYDLLVQVLPDEVYPNSTKEERNYPDCVYKIGGSTILDNLGVDTGGETIFIVVLHAKTHNQATIKFDEIDALLSAEEGIQITDIASDYNKTTGTHEIAFEVFINTPLGFDGTGSVIAIRGNCSADNNQTFPCLQQDETCQYHFIVQAKDSTTLEILLDELNGVLLGYTQSSEYDLLQKGQQQPLQSSGGLLSWVVTYHNTRPITATAYD